MSEPTKEELDQIEAARMRARRAKNFAVEVRKARYREDDLEVSTTTNGCQWTTLNFTLGEAEKLILALREYLDATK
jgi:hypothetical protein